MMRNKTLMRIDSIITVGFFITGLYQLCQGDTEVAIFWVLSAILMQMTYAGRFWLEGDK